MARKKKVARVAPTLAYLGWHLVAKAVLATFELNRDQKVVSGFPADAPEWTTNAELRTDLWTRVRLRWMGLAGRNFSFFPYSEDYVALLYRRVAALSDEGLRRWRREIERTADDVGLGADPPPE